MKKEETTQTDSKSTTPHTDIPTLKRVWLEMVTQLPPGLHVPHELKDVHSAHERGLKKKNKKTMNTEEGK